MDTSKKHVQLPHNMIKRDGMEPKDLLVYAMLKSHYGPAKLCYPSLECISKETGYSINTVRNSIALLESNNYISIIKKGRSNYYEFSPYKTFEPFNHEFLKSNKLESNEKAYILASQQFMIKDQDGIGKTSFTNQTLSEKLNISTRTISRLDTSLVKKGFLDIVKTESKDRITGLTINEKFFHLDELGQTIIWTLQKHEEDIGELKNTTKANTKDLKIALRDNTSMKKEIAELKEQIQQLKNGEVQPNKDEVKI